MTLTITERDKKLLVFLAVFVLTFGGCFLVIQPLTEKNQEMEQALDAESFEMQGKQQKVALFSTVVEGEALAQENVSAAQEKLYDWMSSSEADAMLTELALSHDLTVVSLQLQMPQEGEYTALSAYAPGGSSQTAVSYEGTYCGQARLELTGSRENLLDFLADEATLSPKLRVIEYTWTELEENYQLTVTVAFYMAQPLESYLQSQGIE